MLLRVFEEEHEEQVNHCQFTNTARRLLLATCSNDKFLNVKVWKLLFRNQVAWIYVAAFSSLFSASFNVHYVLSCGISTSRPPKTPCLATLSQSTIAVSPPMTTICQLPQMTVQLRWATFARGFVFWDLHHYKALSCLQLTDPPMPSFSKMDIFNLCVLSSSKWHLPMSGRRSTSRACWRRETKMSPSSVARGALTASTSFAEPGMLC